ncbi:hypothetical protein RUMHYD_01164 [Blautia hydrogenotrophica DSM 10507]|uniref:Prenylated flavin chaperone LpdD-like domain-containing protein n=2 Tax=Blautia hydrogenotrophica TaxID=53443 RepID=C0CJZ4_BLAHS|nr:hypothetical protein RUMHYD_01164 [Blautia hydrogenotrophica DSM 10507]
MGGIKNMTEQWTPKTLHLEIPLSFSSLHLQLQFVGEDLSVLVYGGEHAHIGCTVLSIPRPSLTDSQKTSCTSSVLNVTGHKDEIICRYLSEVITCKYNRTTVCSGGFHCDNLNSEQIQEIVDAVKTSCIDLFKEKGE